MANPVFLIDEPTPFAPRAEWLEHLASLAAIVNQYGPMPELERMVRVANDAIDGAVRGSSQG